MNFHKSLFTVSIIFLSLTSWSQAELGLHFMDKIGQSSTSNPAYFSDNKLAINLASPYVNFYNTGFSIRDVLHKIPGSDSLRLDFDEAIANMDDENYAFFQFQVDVLQATFQINNLQFSLGYGLKNYSFGKYPKSLIDIAWNGNAGYIGQAVNIAPDFQSSVYHELSAGLSMQLMDVLSVGGRFKYLSGVADFSTDPDHNKAVLFTDTDIYQVTLTTDYTIQSSGFPELDSNFQVVEGQSFELFPHDEGFFKNHGFALDLGASFQLSDKLKLTASIIDLGGSIKWDSRLRNYESRGEFTYEGIDLTPLIQGDTLDFSAIGDTLSEVFEIQTATNGLSYSSRIPTKVYLSGLFGIHQDLRVGALLYGEFFRGNVRPAFSLFAQHDFLGDKLQIGVNYSYRNKEAYNIGVNAALLIGPLQIFIASDNILPVFRPYHSRNFNARAGLNLVFF